MSLIDDNQPVRIELTAQFRRWRDRLRDRRAVARIATRLLALERGRWGDVKSVGGGVSELRIDYGPGYRLYLTRRGPIWVVLLCGGDKDSQARDIAQAQELARGLKDGD